MPSYLQRKEGIYEPGQRFAFTNPTEEPFKIVWNGRTIKTVAPHETIEISDATPYPGPGNGDCIARTKAMELATRIILGEARIQTDKLGFLTDKSYVSPVGTKAAVPEARKPYEDLILKRLQSSEDKEALDILNQQKAEEIIADSRRQAGVSYSNQGVEFANAPKDVPKEVKEVSIPVASEEILKPKGRPKKNGPTATDTTAGA